jgi:hypothetical protein
MISSNPYHFLRLQRELHKHGWGDHGWLMERRGDDDVDDLLQIPVPAGYQNEVFGSES